MLYFSWLLQWPRSIRNIVIMYLRGVLMDHVPDQPFSDETIHHEHEICHELVAWFLLLHPAQSTRTYIDKFKHHCLNMQFVFGSKANICQDLAAALFPFRSEVPRLFASLDAFAKRLVTINYRRDQQQEGTYDLRLTLCDVSSIEKNLPCKQVSWPRTIAMPGALRNRATRMLNTVPIIAPLAKSPSKAYLGIALDYGSAEIECLGHQFVVPTQMLVILGKLDGGRVLTVKNLLYDMQDLPHLHALVERGILAVHPQSVDDQRIQGQPRLYSQFQSVRFATSCLGNMETEAIRPNLNCKMLNVHLNGIIDGSMLCILSCRGRMPWAELRSETIRRNMALAPLADLEAVRDSLIQQGNARWVPGEGEAGIQLIEYVQD